MATTDSVNNSRDPVRATCHNSQGNVLRPMVNISTTNAKTPSSVCPMVRHSGTLLSTSTSLPSRLANGGRSTKTNTVTRSSTKSQPIAIRPFMVSITPRASSALSSTTVLAQDNDRPKIRPVPQPQPHHQDRPMPSKVAKVICTAAPGMAIRLTANKSFSEK